MGARDRHEEAVTLIRQGREDEAFGVAQELLRQDPDDAEALYILGNLHAKAEQYGSALLFFRRVVELKPGNPLAMNNLGLSLEGLGRPREARRWFERAHAKKQNDPRFACNISTACLSDGDVKGAEEWAAKAIAMQPDMREAHTARGFALLAMGRFGEGWDEYHHALGGKFRAIQDYGLPVWNGESDARVIVCTEQGIGDEIMYASILPELADRVQAVTLDCDARSERLLRRALGDRITVHGTRAKERHWLKDGEHTHQLMIGELPRFFRRTRESFPGTPFLKTNPDLVAMYDALQGRYAGGKKRIGLTMSGGTYHTGRKRAMGVESFKSLVEQHGDTCEFFSLEYRPGSGEPIEKSGLPIHHFHFVVGQGADYEHTAAFVSTLDMVVGIHTSAHHLAGGLGIPTQTLVPAQPSWQYGLGLGDAFPWYRSVRLFRQKPSESWMQCVKRLAAEFRP